MTLVERLKQERCDGLLPGPNKVAAVVCGRRWRFDCMFKSLPGYLLSLSS